MHARQLSLKRKGSYVSRQDGVLLGSLRETLEKAGVIPKTMFLGQLKEFVRRVSVEAEAKIEPLEGGRLLLRMVFLHGNGHPEERIISTGGHPGSPYDMVFRIEWAFEPSNKYSVDAHEAPYQFVPRIVGDLAGSRNPISTLINSSNDMELLRVFLEGDKIYSVKLVVPSMLQIPGEPDDWVVECPIRRLRLFEVDAARAFCRLSELKADAFSLGNVAAQELERQWAEPIGDRPPSVG